MIFTYQQLEYDGHQHFHPVDFAGKGKEWAEERFEEDKRRDKVKNLYCENNKIKLIRIPYFEFENIENILFPICREFILHKNS